MGIKRMYHYTESGLQNVWLKNGYVIRNTPYGKSVAIHDVEGLHRLIGRAIAQQPRLSGAQLRFLRKEMDMSQSALALLVGTSEQNVSLWERRGRVPKTSDRLIRLIYLEHSHGKSPQIRALIDRINALDKVAKERMEFKQEKKEWKEAA
jgi:DNA-binding transcriptional regulator YiaG